MPIKLQVNKYSLDLPVIYKLLKTHENNSLWTRNKTYIMEGLDYNLSNSIIVKENKKDGSKIYGVLAVRSMYENEASSVVPIVEFFILSATSNTLTFVNNKPHVVKIIKKVGRGSTWEWALREYKKSTISGHLDMSYPIESGNQVYLLMLRMPGVELYNLLSAFIKIESGLPAKFIFMLIDAILRALMQQVTQYKLVHLDIKPENLMVNVDGVDLSNVTRDTLENLVSPRVEVNCIDYGFCRYQGEENDNLSGTLMYLSPERHESRFCDEGPDVYAIGIILQMILGLAWYSRDAIKSSGELELDADVARQICNKLSKNNPDISYSTFLNLIILTLKMVATQPKNRWSLKQSIKAFEYILRDSSLDIDRVITVTKPDQNDIAQEEDDTYKDKKITPSINLNLALIVEYFNTRIKLFLSYLVAIFSFEILSTRSSSEEDEDDSLIVDDEELPNKVYSVAHPSYVVFTKHTGYFSLRYHKELFNMEQAAGDKVELIKANGM